MTPSPAKTARPMRETDLQRLARAAQSASADQPFTWENAARAMLLELRQPTTAMLNAACAAMSPGKRPTPRFVSHKAKHGIRFRAMIDQLLSDGVEQRGSTSTTDLDAVPGTDHNPPDLGPVRV